MPLDLSKWEAIPFYPLDTKPAPDSLDGIPYRLAIVKRALMAGYEDPVEGISDILADVRHLCDAIGLDYDEADQRAQENYRSEVAEDNYLKGA